MENLLAILGGLFGVAIASALHSIFGRFRRQPPLFVLVLGWLVTAVITGFGVMSFVAYLEMRKSPAAPMAEVCGIAALLTVILLLTCVGLSRLQGKAIKIPTPKAFAALMVEVGIATLLILLLNETRYLIADILRGGSRDTEDILDSFAKARHLLMYLDGSLLITFFLLKAIPPLLHRKKE